MPDHLFPLQVVAAFIPDSAGHLLLQQRPPGKHHAGLWEFPGGKVEPGESQQQALAREIAEELGLSLHVDSIRPLHFVRQGSGGGFLALTLHLLNAPNWTGAPCGREGQEWGWFTLAEAAALPLAPLDRELLWKISSANGE